MSWIENILIIAGVSLDLFAAMTCQGSLVSKVNKKHLSIVSLLIGVWQLISLFVGFLISDILIRTGEIPDQFLAGETIAILIFFALGARLVTKAVRNDFFHEKLESDLGYKRFVKMTAAAGIYTMFLGIAFGFFGTSIVMILIMILCCSVVAVVAGMYVGYRFGFEGKGKAYVAGAILLGAAGLDLIVRTVITYVN